MKKTLKILIMLLAFTSFANNSVDSQRKVFIASSNLDCFSKENIVVPGWIAECYVTITNSETGAQMKIYGVGSGATKSAALSNCGDNARKIAMAMVEHLGQE